MSKRNSVGYLNTLFNYFTKNPPANKNSEINEDNDHSPKLDSSLTAREKKAENIKRERQPTTSPEANYQNSDEDDAPMVLKKMKRIWIDPLLDDSELENKADKKTDTPKQKISMETKLQNSFKYEPSATPKTSKQQRRAASNSMRLGFIEELPTGSPLQVPLHPKKRRTLVFDDYSSSSACWSSATPISSAATQPQPSTSSLYSPAHSGANSPCFVPSPLFVDCGNASLTSPQNPRRTLRDAGIKEFFNYGSEEEDELPNVEEEVSVLPVPRSVRILLDEEEDSPIELEAAGRVEEPVRAALNGQVEGPNSLFDFNWVSYTETPICPLSRREAFIGPSGPTCGPIASAYEAFVSIWDRPIMDHMVKQTNQYAQEYATYLLETGQMGPNSRINQWRDTNVDELYTFFAIMIAMGVLVKGSLQTYWNRSEDIFQTPGFAVHMSYMRFRLLSRCLHFSNNAEDIHDLISTEAKIFKIKPIVDHLNEKFQSLYYLGQNIALDESLAQWKGWLDIKQYIPNKAAHVGIKTYEICDSRSGYLWRFEVHAGTNISEDDVIPGHIPSLVLRLVRGLEHRGHTIWMDNYYNSPSLARVLKTRGFDCVGTLRTNRQFVPDQIKDLNKSDMRVGEVYGCTSGDVDIVVWRDQNRVALVSTYHGATVSDGKPTIIKDYNVCMGGVDKKDQMLAAYPMERKRHRIWYKKFFRRLLNPRAAVVIKHLCYEDLKQPRAPLVIKHLCYEDLKQPRAALVIKHLCHGRSNSHGTRVYE
ncbi:hypothetical protein evm_009708 [Chilo suppressalis]|nr:hypothetical protein evm_009708 [Chilo suppressalis]